MIQRPLPKHVIDNLPRLVRWANIQRAYYGFPVYLVGSALSGSNPLPRDWDIRITLTNKAFSIRFGDPQQWEYEAGGDWTQVRWRWADECTRATKSAWAWTRLNVDFQIYPALHVKKLYPSTLPRLRLDSRRPAPPYKARK